MFLLDTNVVSELRKVRPHGGVAAWYAAQNANSFFLPSIVLYELQAGVERTRKQDGVRAKQIEAWIDRIEADAQILHFDASSARLTARLMEGMSEHLFEDAMIAAVARTNGLTVATRNVRDFKPFKVAVVDPFRPLSEAGPIR